jgi:U3 small nucleolar RNA-associated protein 20
MKHLLLVSNKIIRQIVTSLRSRDIMIRDKAREALVLVNVNISPYLFHLTINEMYKSLQKGYQRHVRSYTLHYILEAFVQHKQLKCGEIDHCLEKYDKDTKIFQHFG